ncbi:transposase [Wolbachia endosymbiont of Wuchereria bancrofti]|uniref:transposase n=1 Tax=Wolbachia endosymbiont of Wuchereria bancrofti TaxID=96496 RepID=UPI000B4D1BA9
MLIPILKPGQTIILDNASFHKSERTRKLIETVGYKILFLLPCSPNLNPVEKFWFAVKHAVGKTLSNFWLDINSTSILSFSIGKPYLS